MHDGPTAAFTSAETAPHRYVTDRRIERAKELLSATDLPIAEVTPACGFCDQSHLARWFKRVVGVTPAAYRSGR